MAQLDAKLFGTPQITTNGRTLRLPYKRANALLYYLIVKGRATRSELTGLLWPDTDNQSAMKNLRHAIFSIRKELGWDPFSIQQRDALELSAETEIRCDVSEFLSSGDSSLYKGEFLQGFSVPRAEFFESWLMGERSSLQALYLRALLKEGQECFAHGKLEQTEQFCLAYLKIDPTEENAVMLLMRVYCARQQYRRAISLYQGLCQRLSSEFGIAPLKETTALYYKAIGQWNNHTSKIKEQGEPLVGKELALQELLALCSMPYETRQSTSLLLEGEAGIGKSYLLNHLLSRYDLSDWLICRGFCYQTEMTGSLAVWNSIMMDLVAGLEMRHMALPANYAWTAAALFPGLVPVQGEQLPDCGSLPQSDYDAALRSVLAIFSIVARKIPILLIFEDIHWMDCSSVDLLSLFLRRVNRQDIAVICTARDILPPHVERFVEEGLRDKVIRRHSLRRFTLEETQHFLLRLVARELRTELMERAYQNTGGNALLLTQLANELKEKGDLSDLPQFPEDIIVYRLSSLSQDERQVLELISVFINWAPLPSLSAILQKDTLELTYLCHQLTRKKLLLEEVRGDRLEYCFTHERIKNAVCQRQSESGRRLLHLRTARYLEDQLEAGQTAPYDQLIHHYAEGGDRFMAFRYRVLSLNAYARLRYELLPTFTAGLGTGLANADGLTDYFQVMENELASLRRFTFRQQELDHLEMILLHVQSRCYIHDGHYEKGLAILSRLLHFCEQTGDREMAIQSHFQMVYYGIQTCNSQVMDEHLTVLGHLLEGMEHFGNYGVYLRLSGLLELMCGHYPEARTILRQAIETFLALDPSMEGRYAINIAGVYNYIAETYRLERNYSQAFLNYDQAVAYNRNREHYPGNAMFYTNYGVAAYQSGHLQEAKRLFHYAADIYEESHEYNEYPVTLSYLALFDSEEGLLQQAAERLTRAFELSNAIGSPRWRGITIYITWKIRSLMKKHGWHCSEIESLWPDSAEEHCKWCLSNLHQLQPRAETREMELALSQVASKQNGSQAHRPG